MRAVGYGVIGLGFFGEKHAAVVASLPQAELRAVCTRRAERLQEVQRRLGVPRAYQDYHELLERIRSGALGQVVSLYARRNIPAARSATVLEKIGPLLGDGVHDTDLMLWMTGAKIVSAYALTHSVRGLKNPDIGWAMYRFDSGAVGVIEDVWLLPEGTPFRIHEQLEVLGTQGAVYVHGGDTNLVIQDRQGVDCPDTLYWPQVHGETAGALRAEIDYFVGCVAKGLKPTVVTPEEARAAVAAVAAAERSARTGKIVRV
ncbi:MAG: Gfo/Idh/MocA family oxidoreductase [Planctomycetes bacterium]|nr:Gfo/Idh/MocA family oxidoreductase [Planctomycetota bacterium]